MKTIAISGKGGTGKTTLAALIIRWLSRHEGRPILAVDADANVNLNDLLGVELKDTLGGIREEMRTLIKKPVGGMSKQQFLEYKIQSSLVETADFDLIAMGRPEGPGCYCYANNLLRDILKTLSSNYRYVVIDNQAGMEHLSRQTSQNIDYLLIISDPSLRGIRAAGKISRLIQELDTRVKEKYLVLNRVQDSIPQKVAEAIKEEGLHLLAALPDDPKLVELDQEGRTIEAVSGDSPACLAVSLLLTRLLKLKETKKENP